MCQAEALAWRRSGSLNGTEVEFACICEKNLRKRVLEPSETVITLPGFMYTQPA